MFSRWFTTVLAMLATVLLVDLPRLSIDGEQFRFSWSPIWTTVALFLLGAIYANSLQRRSPRVLLRTTADGETLPTRRMVRGGAAGVRRGGRGGRTASRRVRGERTASQSMRGAG